jgi:hypothetical protein
MNQLHTNVTRGARTDSLVSPEYIPRHNFATSPKPNFSNENSSDDPKRIITARNFQASVRAEQGRGREVNKFT